MFPGKKTPVSIDSNILVSKLSRSISGEGLWKMTLFGSTSASGEGVDRYQPVEQILSEAQAGTSLTGGATMAINDIETMFDIGSIGCTDYEYICVEFTKGSEPVPQYSFQVGEEEKESAPVPIDGIDFSGSAKSEKDVITDCKPQKCNLSK